MKKVLLSIPLAVLLLIVLVRSVSSSDETRGHFGTTSTTITSEKIRAAGFNTIIDLNSTVNYYGTFDGASTVQGTLVVHPDGSADFHGEETFTGTVNGVPGTVTFKLIGWNSSSGDIQIAAVIVNATGDLSNIKGVLWKVGEMNEDGPIGDYLWLPDVLSSIKKPSIQTAW